MEGYNQPLSFQELKQLFAEKGPDIQTATNLSEPDSFPRFRIRLPRSFAMNDEAQLIVSSNPSGYAVQFAENVLYIGRNKSLGKLASGNPVFFTSWEALKEFISQLPDNNGGEQQSVVGSCVIMPDGRLIMEATETGVTPESLFDAAAIKIPVTLSSFPSENVILQELRKNIRGQSLATATVAHQLYAHLCKREPQRPLSFLFHGKPGTGKTEAAKIVGSILQKYCEPKYGFSMTQLNTFTEGHTISRLIGAEPGYVGYEEKGVFETVVDNPYMVYCFDEVEKAHPVILKAFMSILDEGKLASRKELDNGSCEFNFRNCIFIFTSNLNLTQNTPKIGFHAADDVQRIDLSKKGVVIAYGGSAEHEDPPLVQQIYANTEKARIAFMRSGVLAETASRFGSFVEFQSLSEQAKLEILARMILHIGFEYGVRLSKIDNGIMQELANSASAENGLTVRSYRAVIEGYLSSAFAATSGVSGGDSGTFRLGGTLAQPLILPTKNAPQTPKTSP